MRQSDPQNVAQTNPDVTVVKKSPPAPGAGNDGPKRPIRLTFVRIDPIAVLALIVAAAAAIYQHIDSGESTERLNQFGERLGKIMQETVVGLAKVTDSRVIFNGHEYKAPPGPIEIEFWTPSIRTKESPGAKDWEKIDNEQRLELFAEKLMKAHILKGYRRYDVVGQGSRGPRQAGAWWVSSNDSDFDMKAFLIAYYEFWKPGEDSVYLEITRVASAYRPVPQD